MSYGRNWQNQQNGPVYIAAPEAVCYSHHPRLYPPEPDRTRPPCADPTPRSPPGNELPPEGPKPAILGKMAPILPIFRRSNHCSATHPSRCPCLPGPVGRNGTAIGGPNHELRLKPAKMALIFPIFRHPNRRAATPLPDAPTRLVLLDETEMQSEALIMSYG